MRPTEQRLVSNALGSLPPLTLLGVAADSAILSAEKRRDRATGSLPAPLGGPSAIRLKHRKP